ncbi:MAG: hypothetical protein J5I98_07920 [Phaeodactylibacter sp.]|nr:hypothetical protein [Phaeodactylibacter sp.]
MNFIEKFIADAVIRIAASFPTVTVEYQYSKASNTHFFRVTPQTIFDSVEFLSLEGELYRDWTKIENETGDAFCLLSEDSLITLNNPSIVFEPDPLTFSFSYPTPFEKEINPTIVDDRTYCISGGKAPTIFSDSTYKLAA